MQTNRRKAYKYNRKIGMSIVNAAIASGYPRSLAEKHSKRLPVPLNHNNNTDFFALFEQKQMTDIKKVEHAIAGMNATKVISVEVTNERSTRGQRVYVEREVPDWQARHKYFETMLRLCKQLEKGDTTVNALVLGGNFADQLRMARERATEEMKARLVEERKEDDIDVTPSRIEEAVCL